MNDNPVISTSSTTTKPQNLPPGVVIGPDGKPCKICTAFRNWKPQGSVASMGVLATRKIPPSTGDHDTRPSYCPPDVEQLGRATWAFLHTTAAYYPERPSPHQRANMLNLLHSLPVLYPCSHCASHLGESMKTNPPDVGSRIALSRWLCERHNEVNERLGKESFDCAKTVERWRDGPQDGSCE
ncbi:hypothetical protein ID866_7050 [Astraeus odoratus]|nr:hypothetical protein ID866_7050 [Astraeus odoratus]